MRETLLGLARFRTTAEYRDFYFARARQLLADEGIDMDLPDIAADATVAESDRVLGLVVADMLFHRFPTEAEGALARRHAALVRREALARVAQIIGLPEHLVLSRGEEEAGGRANPGLLADACEAVIGALFADAGFEKAQVFVRTMWTPLMDEAAAPPKDAKTALQEWAQGRGKKLPVYTTVGTEGPPHDPTFSVSVEVEGVETVVAKGASKRAAEQAAATQMLENVTK